MDRMTPTQLRLLALCCFATLWGVYHATAPAASGAQRRSGISPGANGEGGGSNGGAAGSAPWWTVNIGGVPYADAGGLCSEPIDVVYTWVNGSDPVLQREMARYRSEALDAADEMGGAAAGNHTAGGASSEAGGKGGDDAATGAETADDNNRYRDNDELRYSLRSLVRYAPWVHHVYIVTNGQVPSWLNLEFPGVTVVPHSMIFEDPSHLPTFSSPAIEVHIHKIPHLSRKFIYFNDDVFLGAPVYPDDFVTRSGGQKVYLAWDVPDCASGCPDSWVGDGYCDEVCNVTACGFDRGDCANVTKGSQRHGMYDNYWDSNSGDWGGGGGQGGAQKAYSCAPTCPEYWIGDQMCDSACDVISCGFDAGDCTWKPKNTAAMTKLERWYNITSNGQAFLLPHCNAGDGGRPDADAGKKDVSPGYDDGHDDVYGGRMGPFDSGIDDRGSSGSASPDAVTFAFNLTAVYGPGRIIDATHDSPDLIGSAVLTQQLKTLFLGFFGPVLGGAERNAVAGATLRDIAVSITGYKDTDEGEKLVTNFNISTYVKNPNAAASDALEAAQSLLDKDDGLDDAAGAESSPSTIDPEGTTVIPVPNAADTSGNGSSIARAGQRRLAHWEEGPGQAFVRRLLRPGRRRLLESGDTFGDSLRYVTKFLNGAYGSEARKVPAHMPHMIDRDVVAEMHAKWPEQFAETSSHRFRSSNDMQFAFSFFYYLMSEPASLDTKKMWDEDLDRDHNGVLGRNELRTLAALLVKSGYWADDYDADITPAILDTLERSIKADGDLAGTYDHGGITYAAFASSATAMDPLRKAAAENKKFKFEIKPMDEVAFHMIKDNATIVERVLDGIRARKAKFVCLNDDMNKSHTPNDELLSALHDFYLAYFPEPSKFEIPPGSEPNAHQYLDDLIRFSGSARRPRATMSGSLLNAAIVAIVALLLFCLVRLRRGALFRSRGHRVKAQHRPENPNVGRRSDVAGRQAMV